MIKIIAILILAFLLVSGHGGIGTQPHTCSGVTPNDFSTPPYSCPPDTIVNPACKAACEKEYKEEMAELTEYKCVADKNVMDQFQVDWMTQCWTDYHDCELNCPHCPSCQSILIKCQRDVWTDGGYQAMLDQNQSQFEAWVGAIEAQFPACMSTCCENE